MAKAAMTGKKQPMSFDEACEINIPEYTGLNPVNSVIWTSLLTDLSESLFTWQGALDFYDLLLIERFIHHKKMFCLVIPKYKRKNAIIFGQVPRIMECTAVEYGIRNKVVKVRLVVDKPPKDMIMSYPENEFVLFDNFSYSSPALLAKKYSDILGKLDALYDQNIDKLSIPIIGIAYKTLKNELLNIFRRTKLNALYALVNGERGNVKVNELFYNPEVNFILDKINAERSTMMKEYLEELGVNPNDEVGNSTHYVNTASIKESSLISKYFSASMNKYRTNFCNKCNARYPGLNLTYYATVKTYSEEVVKNGEVD